MIRRDPSGGPFARAATRLTLEGRFCQGDDFEILRYANAVDDQALWDRFTSSKLVVAEWTHESHVRTAFLFSNQFPIDEAHLRMRAGIIRLNERHGLIETSGRGYFETLTRVWLVLVTDGGRRTGATSSLELIGRCPELLDRALPLRHYTRELLATTRARSIFVEPDLAPLPDVR